MKINGTENNGYILHELGQRIQDTRVAMALTQKDMADKAGVSPRTIERIENGENVKIENILNVLRVLQNLGNLDMVITEQETSPAMLFELGRKRKRVTTRQKENEKTTNWKWGDEQ